MVTKAKNYVANLRKKGGSTADDMPQSNKAKVPPQPPSQDDPQGTKTATLGDVTTPAAATLGKLSGNKDNVVTTVTTPEDEDDGNKKMPAVNTPKKLKDPPAQTRNIQPTYPTRFATGGPEAI